MVDTVDGSEIPNNHLGIRSLLAQVLAWFKSSAFFHSAMLDEDRRRQMLRDILRVTPWESVTAVLKELGLPWVRELRRVAVGVEIWLSRGKEPCFLATCPNLADDTRVKCEANVQKARGQENESPTEAQGNCVREST